MIKHISMKHGWFYFYRLHTLKASSLIKDEFNELNKYLENMFHSCPHDYFTIGPRSSSLTFDINIDQKQVNNHETCYLASEALEKMNNYKANHSKVEVFMLEKDNSTIAVEVPIWLNHYELEVYDKLFSTKEPLSGHIDILRIEDNKIWIWDYKPKAHKEKYAHVQTLFYAIMLSKRTGIDLKHFKCGYFDESTSYVFNPCYSLLNQFKN
jgi:hypothetical protein